MSEGRAFDIVENQRSDGVKPFVLRHVVDLLTIRPNGRRERHGHCKLTRKGLVAKAFLGAASSQARLYAKDAPIDPGEAAPAPRRREFRCFSDAETKPAPLQPGGRRHMLSGWFVLRTTQCPQAYCAHGWTLLKAVWAASTELRSHAGLEFPNWPLLRGAPRSPAFVLKKLD